MPAYKVLQNYRSGTATLPPAGSVVELELALAEWIERDSPGTLTPHTEPAEARAFVAPPANRMIESPPARRGRPRKV